MKVHTLRYAPLREKMPSAINLEFHLLYVQNNSVSQLKLFDNLQVCAEVTCRGME